MKKRVISLILIAFLMFGSIPSGLFKEVTALGAAGGLSEGDYFILGTYLGEKIVWRHVGSDGTGDVALSFRVLTSKAYNSVGAKPDEQDTSGDRALFGSNVWINSTLRAWLNASGAVSYVGNRPSSGNVTANPYDAEPGFLTGFLAYELDIIKQVSRPVALNEIDADLITQGTQVPDWDSGGGLTDPIRHYVTDKVFLPDAYLLTQIASKRTLDWYVGYWWTGFHRAGITQSALTNASSPQTPAGEYAAVDYWTGTPQGSQWNGTHLMQIRLIGGGHSFVNVSEGVMGVRPAFYINHDKITITGGSGTQADPYILGTFDTDFGITLKGTTEKLYAPATDKLQITVPELAGLTLSYKLFDPESTDIINTKAAFGTADGTLSPTNGKAELSITQNCKVVVMAEATVGGAQKTAFASFTYKNFFEPVRVYQQGKADGTNEYLYHATLIDGLYGVPINEFKSGAVLAGADYDKVSAIAGALPSELRDFWQPKSDNPNEITLDNAAFIAASPTLTMFYEKKSTRWVTVYFYLVDENGDQIAVNGAVAQPITKENWIPQGMKMSQVGASFTVPTADTAGLTPYQWGMYDMSGNLLKEHTEINNYESVGFDPQMPIDQTRVEIRIYYRANQFMVTETHKDAKTGATLKINPVSITLNEYYTRSAAPEIDHYVVTGYKIGASPEVTLSFDSDGKPIWQPICFEVTADMAVEFYYEPDANSDGIPDSKQVQVTTRHVGIYNDDRPNTLIASETKTVLKGAETTVTNALFANWVFDGTMLSSPHTFTPNEDTIVRFYYNYDSAGTGTADKDHTVTTRFRVTDGSSLDNPQGWSDVTANIVQGGLYLRAAPARQGYVAVGWLLDTEDAGQKREFTGRNGNQAEFTTQNPTHTVTFLYRAESAPVTIKWIGVDANNVESELGFVTVTGFVGEALAIDKAKLRASVSVDRYLWSPSSDNIPEQIVFTDLAQEFAFRYEPAPTSITVRHYYLDGAAKVVLAEYAFQAAIGSSFTADSENFPGFEPVTGSKTITVESGSMNLIELRYTSKYTTVTVNAMIGGSSAAGFTPIIMEDIEIGSVLTVDAPYIALHSPDAPVKTVTVTANHQITFNYTPLPSGQVRVILKEDDTNGRVIAEESHSLAYGYSMIVPIPDLSGRFYTALSDTPKTVTYKGTPITVEYYYERDMVQVYKKTYNSTGQYQIAQFDMGMYRVGELARFYAPSKEEYALDDAALKIERIMPPPQSANPYARVVYYHEVSFNYVPIGSGMLVVEAVNESGSVLTSYTLSRTDGEYVTVGAPSVADYVLAPGEPMSKTERVPGKVTFKYVRAAGAEFADLEVVVKSQTGAGLSGADVTVKLGGMTVRSCTTVSGGSVVLTDLPSGEVYTVTARLSGYLAGTASVTLNGNKRVEITLTKPAQPDDQPDVSTPTPPVAPSDDGLLEKAQHIAYIDGYDDGTVRPDALLTRAQTAVMFHRLLKDNNTGHEVSFTDIADGQWFADAAQTLGRLGILRGYPDGTFGPHNTVTRAEFAAILSRFASYESPKPLIYKALSDMEESHWAYGYVCLVMENGWMETYENYEFRPDETLTRADAIVIINRLLGRKVRKEDIPLGVNRFSDLSRGHPAFAAILEASVPHGYKRDEEGYEIWELDE